MALSLFDIEMMPSAEFRKKIDTDPAFKAEFEALTQNPTSAPTGVDPVTPVEEVAVEVPVEPTPAPTPVAAAPITPVELPEQRFEYQPTDEQGRPIGGRQVIKFRTEQERVEKLVEQNTLLIRQLRKVNREKVLGIEEALPTDAEKFDKVIEFKSTDLSSDERFQLSRELNDPSKFVDARDRLIESALGAKPATITKILNDLQQSDVQRTAVENYVQFVNETGMYDSPENREVLTGWMRKKGLRPTVANFNLALSTLRRDSGLIQDAPVVRQEPVPPAPAPTSEVEPEPVVPVETVANPQPPVAATPGLGSEPQPQAKRHSHVPSGLNASVASAAGPITPAVGSSLTLADLDKMPSDIYKQKLRDPAFAKMVNQLYADTEKKQRARSLGQV
jgi:hypothetical protein